MTQQPTHPEAGSKPAPGLYLVATPIGNLDDITLRALKILQGADLIACEDTRVTGKLLSLLGIAASALTPYHEHNAERASPALLEKLRDGAVVALVSDAGTPLLSDPGFRLVRAALAEGIPVTSAPGASAALTALQLSGLPSDRFLFAGFLPSKTTARRSALMEIAAIPATLIIYESPRRLAASLSDMVTILGPREAAVARELTKLFEEVRRAPLDVLAAHYAEAGAPKGEVVLVIAPPGDAPAPTPEDIDQALREALAAHKSLRDAVAEVTAKTGQSRRDIYARAILLCRG